VRREGGAAARAVRNDLVALIEAAVVPDAPERPPHRLDVLVREGDVRVVQVEPEADALRELVPVLDVPEHGFAAELVELGDSVLLDLGGRRDPELALDLELDRQPVTVPARLARNPVPTHGLVARIDVLEHPGEDVVGAGPSVGGRRPLVKTPHRRVAPHRERAMKHVALAPALEDPLFERGEGGLRIDRPIGRHRG
jgi:hypothetical protein